MMRAAALKSGSRFCDYRDAAVGIATCETPDGNFVCHGHFNPYGYMSRDCTLFKDGSFLDTTTGTRIIGTYRFDGVPTYMLIPQVGGYVNLTVAEDGKHAERVEAAGFISSY